MTWSYLPLACRRLRASPTASTVIQGPRRSTIACALRSVSLLLNEVPKRNNDHGLILHSDQRRHQLKVRHGLLAHGRAANRQAILDLQLEQLFGGPLV
jgi:hypothetical protein